MRKPAFVVLVLIAAFAAPATAHATFPGGNGKIAFVRSGDIWTMNADGTNQVNLTNDAPVQSSPAWSADGNKIAFDEIDGGNLFTWWMLADGTNRVLADNNSDIVDRHDPAWNPAGTRIVFTNGPGIFSMYPDGTGIFGIWCCGNANPDWSPANDLIGFQDENACHFFELWVIAPDGTGARDLTPQPAPGCQLFVDGFSWSPDAQRIVYYDGGLGANGLFTLKPDGTDVQPVPGAGGPNPVYSPDGTKFAYDGSGGIHTMSTSGTGDTLLAPGTEPAWQPLPSSGPSADVLATLADAPDPVRAGDELHYTASAKNLVGPDPASGVTLTIQLPATVFFVSATPTQGSCSQSAGVVTCNLGALAKGSSASVDIDVEPRGVIADTTIAATAQVSPNEADSVPSNNSATTTTTVTPGGYARPQGATPLRVSLVPAYRSCGSEATLQHGAPLSHPSCANPQPASGHLTVGTPDANGQTANFIGSVRFTALGEGPPVDPGNGDQADIGVDVSLSDVRNKADLSDYTGELALEAGVRITDHDNGAGGFTPATVQDSALDFTLPCAATASPATGATCVAHTSADALTPGIVKELQRMVWQLGQVRVLDGGPDGVVSTANNTLFAVQGVFVP